jgi:hypothetical protein
MGILDTLRGRANEVDQAINPLRQVADVIGAANEKLNADPTGLKAAKAAGQLARQEATDRGKEIEVRDTPTGAIERKEFPR